MEQVEIVKPKRRGRQKGFKAHNFKDMSGMVFGRLTVLYRAENKYNPPRAAWMCKCSCGREKSIDAHSLTRGCTKSCGCLSHKPHKYLQPGEAAFNQLLKSYKHGAERRGHVWELPIEVFRSLTLSDCVYCGQKPSQVSEPGKYKGDFVFTGIDRVDNSKGYIIDNCVPCCRQCNQAKSTMEVEAFKAWILRAALRISQSRSAG